MKIILSLLIVCCAAALAVSLIAGDNKNAVEKEPGIAKILLGKDPAAIHKLEISLREQQERTISALIFVLEKESAQAVNGYFQSEAGPTAALLLGKLRAVESVKPLCDSIHLGPLAVSTRTLGTIYPCYAALVRIGKPASLECLKRLASEKFRESKKDEERFGTRSELFLMVVQKVEGDEVAKFMLQNAIEKEQDKDKKANLTAALALLDKWIKEREELEKELKEKFPPKDQNPPAAEVKPANHIPLEDELKKGGPKEWEAALADNTAQRQAIIKFLMERVKDEKETPENRILAATFLGRARMREAADFLFENISVVSPIPLSRDIDSIRSLPCLYALIYEASWEKVPALLDYLQTKHENIELIYIVLAVEKTPGNANMLGLLEQVYLRPANEVHKKNLRLVMDYLLNELRPGCLTPAQVERKKLLEDNKIEYGQLPEESNKKPPEKDKPESCPSSPTPMEPDDKPANP